MPRKYFDQTSPPVMEVPEAATSGRTRSKDTNEWGQALAQEANPTVTPQNPAQVDNNGEPVNPPDQVPLYRVRVVGRNLDAVNYMHRSGSTDIAMRGTDLLPTAHGMAKVKSESGRVTVNLHVEGLGSPSAFGPAYLTYVLWAIMPDGRPQNLGEILPNGKMDLTVTSPVPAFGMIVTAEPYFAVSQPSDLVAMQNMVLDHKTNGVVEHVNAHYTLLARGAYTQEVAGVATTIRNSRSSAPGRFVIFWCSREWG
jgi:hypothetical protein